MKIKKPWLSVVLNVFCLGVGYIYNGKRVSFGILLTISTLINYYAIDSNENDNYMVFFSGLLVIIAVSMDSYEEALDINKEIMRYKIPE